MEEDNYQYRDNLIASNRDEKLLAAQIITGLGYHKTVEELFKEGNRQAKIAEIINRAAGIDVVTRGSINNSLMNLGLVGGCIPKNRKQRATSVPRPRKKREVPTGIVRPCLQCDRKFHQTNLNHARCPSCTSNDGRATDTAGGF